MVEFQKLNLKFEVCFDFFPLHQVIFFERTRQADPALAPSVSDRGEHEEMELISTHHFDKFSVWSPKSCGNMKLRLLVWCVICLIYLPTCSQLRNSYSLASSAVFFQASIMHVCVLCTLYYFQMFFKCFYFAISI
jgi:hypothetical protein